MIPNTTVTIKKPPAAQQMAPGTKQPVAPDYQVVAEGVRAYKEPINASPIASALGRTQAAKFLFMLWPATTEVAPGYRLEEPGGQKFEVTGYPLRGPLGVEFEAEVRS